MKLKNFLEPDCIAYRYSGYIFDLDGTIYLSDTLIAGADEVISALRQANRKVCFLSNKPLQTAEDYAHKLTRLGIPTDPSQVINSSRVAAHYLARHHPQQPVFVVGEAALIGELLSMNIPVTPWPDEAQIVLLSFDRGFDYIKLNDVLIATRHGAQVIATNPDVTCPVEGGEIPDCGAFIAAVEACCRVKVAPIVGKPSQLMIDTILELMQLPPNKILLAGDRPETDIVMGHNAGMDTCLVLSGVTKTNHLNALPVPPTYILPSVAALLRPAGK